MERQKLYDKLNKWEDEVFDAPALIAMPIMMLVGVGLIIFTVLLVALGIGIGIVLYKVLSGLFGFMF